ncbi:hypothetical protein F4776DRAFT_638259 [Hypoxylon sp. NC0597]|nr:hypothetical protein F4776DRAFT_638259 [Hypoxylon sp. NC0597]
MIFRLYYFIGTIYSLAWLLRPCAPKRIIEAVPRPAAPLIFFFIGSLIWFSATADRLTRYFLALKGLVAVSVVLSPRFVCRYLALDRSMLVGAENLDVVKAGSSDIQ